MGAKSIAEDAEGVAYKAKSMIETTNHLNQTLKIDLILR